MTAPLLRSGPIEARARLAQALRRALPTVGYCVLPAQVERLAEELVRQGVVVKHKESARARARRREGAA
jgi:DNA-binding transcriptional MocR family regulator